MATYPLFYTLSSRVVDFTCAVPTYAYCYPNWVESHLGANITEWAAFDSATEADEYAAQARREGFEAFRFDIEPTADTDGQIHLPYDETLPW